MFWKPIKKGSNNHSICAAPFGMTVASSSFSYTPKFHSNSVWEPCTFQFCWFLLSPWANKLFTTQSQCCDFTFLIVCTSVLFRFAHSPSLQFCSFLSYVRQGSAHNRPIQSWARDSGAPEGQRDGERFWLGRLWQNKRAWRMTAAVASHFHSLSLASPSICFLVTIFVSQDFQSNWLPWTLFLCFLRPLAPTQLC